MATTRIKDLSKTATTVNSDANLVLDGNTGGTQKITRDNFRQDTADAFVAAPGTYNLAPINSGTGKIDATYLPTSSDTPKGAWNASTNTPTLADGSGTAGDYYDVTVAGSSDLGSGSITFTVGDVVKYNGTTWFKIDSVTNILDGVSTIDGAKAAIEIPDVGTDPSEVPLNQHLGSMAYQSADSVAVDDLEVTGKLDIDSSGNVSIGAGDVANNGSLHVYRSSATADLNLQSAGGSGRSYALQSKADGNLVIRDNNAAADRVTIDSSGDIDVNTGDITQRESSTIYNKLDTDSSGLNLTVNAGQANVTRNLIFKTSVTGGAVTERMRLDGQGRLAVNNTSPGNYNNNASNLVIGNGSGSEGLTIATGSGAGEQAKIFFANGATPSGTAQYQGYINFEPATNTMLFGTAGTQRWSINSSGNLVANSTGIDFGSTNTNTGVTVTGSVMSEYEQGTFSPKLADAATGGNEATIGTVGADYIRVGNQVFFAMRLIDINTTGLTSGNTIYITDMPYVCKSGSSFVPFNVMADTLTFGGQLVGVIQGGVGYANLRQFSNGAGDSAVPVSAISSGATDLFISGSYFVA